jgi:para-nitrobenzyl esterase
MGRYVTDRIFRSLALRIAEARAEAASAPTWLGLFTWRSPTHGLALHCLDVPFAFDNLDAERLGDIAGDAPPRELATELHSDLVEFVRSGRLGWPSFTIAEGTAKRYDLPCSVVPHAYESVRPLL